MVDVSVCIANWNCREHLEACLASLHRPHGVSVEVVVVDNASTDGAADMVARQFPDVVLRRNDRNLGFSRANNQAARLARGRYLFFLNNDTVVPPGALGRLVDYARAHPEAGMIGPRLRDGSGRLQVSCRPLPTAATLLNRTSLLRWTGLLRRRYRRYRRDAFDPEATRPVEMLLGAAILVPREVLTRCGGWDEGFTFGAEDLEFCWRVGRQFAVVYHPEVEIVHHGRVSTRRHIAYAAPHTAAGLARYLRKRGSGRSLLLAYKLAVTADAPLQLAAKGLQYLARRLRGRRRGAARSLLAVRGLWNFLARGLPAFWKA